MAGWLAGWLVGVTVGRVRFRAVAACSCATVALCRRSLKAAQTASSAMALSHHRGILSTRLGSRCRLLRFTIAFLPPLVPLVRLLLQADWKQLWCRRASGVLNVWPQVAHSMGARGWESSLAALLAIRRPRLLSCTGSIPTRSHCPGPGTAISWAWVGASMGVSVGVGAPMAAAEGPSGGSTAGAWVVAALPNWSRGSRPRDMPRLGIPSYLSETTTPEGLI